MSDYGRLWEEVRGEREKLRELGLEDTSTLERARASYQKLKADLEDRMRRIESRLANWAEIEKDM